MKLRKVLIVLCIAMGIMSLAACGPKAPNNTNNTNNQTQQTKYPQKPIKVISMLTPNIPPDITSRKVVDIMKTKFGWQMDFENDAADKGGSAINKVWAAPHDGYTVLVNTELIVTPNLNGTTNHPTKDWKFFVAEQDNAILCVKSSLNIKTLDDLIKYAKDNPGKFTLGVSSSGNAFHIKALALQKAAGVKFDIKTAAGTRAQVPDIKAGKLDGVLYPVQVAKPLIFDETLRPIASAEDKAYNLGGTIGSIESIVKTYPEYGNYLPLAPSISLAMPKDVPQDVADAFGKAFSEAMQTAEMAESARATSANILNLTGAEASKYMGQLESNFAWLAYDQGLAKVSPET